MPTLYVQLQGAQIRLTSERLVVEDRDDTEVESVRLREVDAVVVVGAVGLTTPAMVELLERAIPVTFLSSSGRYRGRLVGATGKDVFLRRDQFSRLEDAQFRLRNASAIVQAKLGGGRALLARHARNHPELELGLVLAELDAAIARAASAGSPDELMGIEGDAARTYFQGLGAAVRSESFVFGGRSRRPPLDPMNAMMSFGYSLMLGECIAALHAAGLDPAVGILHELDYGRPSLALDLLEELRHPVVDRLVLRLVNRRMVTPDGFEPGEEGGIYLAAESRKTFLRAYDEMMRGDLQLADAAVPARELLRRQAERLRDAVRSGGVYEPIEVE